MRVGLGLLVGSVRRWKRLILDRLIILRLLRLRERSAQVASNRDDQD